jgi:hypothetical protein
MPKKLLGIINVDFDTIGQLLTIHQILEEKSEYNEALYRLQKTYDSVRREVL